MAETHVKNALVVSPSGQLPPALRYFIYNMAEGSTVVGFFDRQLVQDTRSDANPHSRSRCSAILYGVNRTKFDAIIVLADSWQLIPEAYADITWVATETGLPPDVRLPYGARQLVWGKVAQPAAV